jgi:hypothetical protein
VKALNSCHLLPDCFYPLYLLHFTHSIDINQKIHHLEGSDLIIPSTRSKDIRSEATRQTEGQRGISSRNLMTVRWSGWRMMRRETTEWMAMIIINQKPISSPLKATYMVEQNKRDKRASLSANILKIHFAEAATIVGVHIVANFPPPQTTPNMRSGSSRCSTIALPSLILTSKNNKLMLVIGPACSSIFLKSSTEGKHNTTPA